MCLHMRAWSCDWKNAVKLRDVFPFLCPILGQYVKSRLILFKYKLLFLLYFHLHRYTNAIDTILRQHGKCIILHDTVDEFHAKRILVAWLAKGGSLTKGTMLLVIYIPIALRCCGYTIVVRSMSAFVLLIKWKNWPSYFLGTLALPVSYGLQDGPSRWMDEYAWWYNTYATKVTHNFHNHTNN